MALVLYAATALALLWLAHRFISLLSPISAAILFLLPLCFTGRALLTGGVYAPVELPYLTEPLRDMRVPLGVPIWHNGLLSDLYAQMIPWRRAVQYALERHQWPLWNPFMLSGSLLAASAQPAVYSPFTLLACLVPIADSLTYSATITFFIAALGAFLFAREIGCRPTAALTASVAWMYSMPIAFFVLWAIGSSWVFLPLVLLGTRRCVWHPSVTSAALLMIALTLLLVAGHPETAVHSIFVGGIYGIFELARRREQLGKSIAAAFAAGVIALLLCAIYVLPILDAAPQSGDYQFRREVWSHEPHGAIAHETLARLLTDIFPFVFAQRWKLPDVRYVPLDSSAVGSIVLALAIYAMIRSRKAETWFFTGLAIFGLLARAAWAPLANAIQRIPLFDMTLTERFSFAAAFAFSVLAAIAVEELLRRGRDRVAVYALFAALVFFTAGTLWIRTSGIVVIKIFPEFGHYAEIADILGLALAALAVIWRPALLVPILLLQRALAGFDLYPTIPRFAAYPPIPILELLKRVHEPFRIVGQHHAFIPATSALYGLEDVRGYEALTFDRYLQTYSLWCVGQPIWFNRVDDLTRPFLSFLNVRYAITTGNAPEGWHVVAQQRGSRLLENERVLPRAFIPNRAIVGSDHPLEEMQNATDFRDCVWIEAPVPRREESYGPSAISIEQRANGFRFRVVMSRAGRIVISEPAWKGWRAYVDGHRVEWQFANLAFLGVYVPAGSHTVRLIYLPEAFVRGRAITAATLLGLLIFGFVRWRMQTTLAHEQGAKRSAH